MRKYDYLQALFIGGGVCLAVVVIGEITLPPSWLTPNGFIGVSCLTITAFVGALAITVYDHITEKQNLKALLEMPPK